jgi:type IV secretory pathway VirB2 component (pilin)
MPLPSPYTWTTRVSGNSSANRPYNLLDGNLRKYDNDFASATVTWTPVNISGTTPTAGVSGGTFNQTSTVVGLELYRTSSTLTAPFFAAEVDCSAFSTGSRTVDTWVGIGLATATGLGYLFYRYNCKTHVHEIVRRPPGGAEEVVQTVTQTLTAPFTLSIAVQGKFVVGRATSAGSGVDQILLSVNYVAPGINLRHAADIANYRVAWLAGSVDADLVTGSTASVTINAVRSAVFGGISIREQYPVATKADGGPVTDGTGRILMLCTNQAVEFTSGTDIGLANLGLYWYDPVAYTFSDCITRIYSMRNDGTIGGDSDGCIVYDDVLKQWHIYVSTTDNPSFNILYQRYDGNLLNAGVIVLDSQVPLTYPTGVGTGLTFDPSVRYISGEWYLFFSNGILAPCLVKGSSPTSFTTTVLSGLSGSEGTKFAKLDGTWYALVTASPAVTSVYDLAGNFVANDVLANNPSTNTFQPHPSITVEQYNDGTDKRRYHHVTFEDSLTTADGHDWTSDNGWQFGSTFVQTTEARTGWDHAVSAADFSSYSAPTPDYAVDAGTGTTPANSAITLTIAPTSSWTATVTPSVALNGETVTVTGTFSPSSLSWTASATPQTITFTPTSEGTAILFFRNSSTTNDPPNVRIAVQSAWAAEVRSDNPIGWWRLGTGYTITNLIEGAPEGSGLVTLTDADGLLPAETDHALTFAGGSISVENVGAYQISTGTIKAWIKTSSPGASFRGIFGKGSAFDLFLIDGVLGAYDWGGAAIRSTGVNLADGVAHEVAMSFQSGVTNGTKIYIDGLPVLTTTITISSQATGLTIGTSGAGQEFAGTIDECRIYGTVLSDARILADYTAATDSPPTLSTVTVDATGTTITDAFSETVTVGDFAEYSLHGGAAAITFTSATGSGDDSSWGFTASRVIYKAETLTLNYSGTGTVDTSSNLLATITGKSVTNNSAVICAVPTGLRVSRGDTKLRVNWDANTEPVLQDYKLYRSTTSGGTYSLVATILAGTQTYLDTGLTNGQAYFYKITSRDTAGTPNESVKSSFATATPAVSHGTGPAFVKAYGFGFKL